MFTRPIFNAEPEHQGAILDQVTKLVDSNILIPIHQEALEWTEENLRKAHAQLESGRTIGKVTLSLKL